MWQLRESRLNLIIAGIMLILFLFVGLVIVGILTWIAF
jgi:hypothetical protein